MPTMAEMLTEYLTSEDGRMIAEPDTSCYHCTQDAFMAGAFGALAHVFLPGADDSTVGRAQDLIDELQAYHKQTREGAGQTLVTMPPAGRA